jgi:adenosylmethionine-8-amino-7-oxononanoate aminotransferase
LESQWVEKDRKYIWHPYTQHGLGLTPLPVVSAQGAYLELADGTRVLDAISSWWVNVMGHSHPVIAQAIADQAKKLDHVIFAGFTHQPAVELAETLLDACRERGASFSKVFYSDNGSTAVEVALKMAFQSHHNKNDKTRTRFLALKGSYHGDTFGAMSVGDPQGLHPLFRPLLAPVDFVTAGDLLELEECLEQKGSQYAAWIVEPLIQGAGGMNIYSPEYLREGIRLCRKAGIPVIFDEVFTGFYRTGTAFAFEQVGECPDFLCLSKGITGGFLPLAVTLTTEPVFEAFHSSDLTQAFLHGHSYTANPIACAAAIATWKLLEAEETQERIRQLTQITKTQLAQIQTLPQVQAVRSLGTIGVIQLKGQSSYFSGVAPRIRASAIKKGILLRPLGNVLYTVPPYCLSDAELIHVFQVTAELIQNSCEVDESASEINASPSTEFLVTDA